MPKKEGFDYERAKAEVGDIHVPDHLNDRDRRLWIGAAAVLKRNSVSQEVKRNEVFKFDKAS